MVLVLMLTSNYVSESLVCDHSNIMLYKVLLTFKSVDETLLYDHSNESY